MTGLAPLHPAEYAPLVRAALAEDVGPGDRTTAATVPAEATGTGQLLAKADLVVAGLDVARAVFEEVAGRASLTFDVHRPDGSVCRPGDLIAHVRGQAAALLTAERTALNFLQRLSGTATLTRRYVQAAEGRITVLDTRKTTPMLRVLEKYAVRVGGGTNHRVGLFDQVLIKDNHIRLAGGIAAAIASSRRQAPGVAIEVEAQSLAQVGEAVEAGADIVLLDNLSLEEIHDAVRAIAGRARVEISGGVTLDRIPALAATGADFVSVGALTHSAPAADISLEIEPV